MTGAQQIQFGLFDWLDMGGMSLTDKYEQRLKMVEFADRAGFWGYHLAEHTLRPLGGSPSPNVFLSAVAQRTQHLHLGPWCISSRPTIRFVSCRRSACWIT
jgi:alkanesulfonate monooxygenase SsuD/methylene tetrahydromethanopterin reductase-like flavin-dependent oxidoreductase (luciferase family)